MSPVTAPTVRSRNGAAALPAWEELEDAVPAIVVTMRRYLEQIACILRPGSVVNTDIALRSFAGFVAETAPEVTCTAQVTRRHMSLSSFLCMSRGFSLGLSVVGGRCRVDAERVFFGAFA